MIATRESISKFIEGKVITDLAGITIPEMRFAVRSDVQPPEFPNVLNLYFFDDLNSGKYYPHIRDLIATFELLVQIDANSPLSSERQTYQVMMLINNFMKVQACNKMDYSGLTPVSLGTQIHWRDSYPLEWISVRDENERYIHKSSSLVFHYTEEKVVVG